jgi:putative lipoprotein
MKLFAIIIAAALGVPAAGAANHTEAVPLIMAQAETGNAQEVAALTQAEWRVLELNGKEAAAGVISTLEFGAEGAVYGSGGCNRFRGHVEIKGTSMKFGPLGSTMMACEDEKSAQEALFHAAMEQTASYSLEGGELKLLDAEGTTLVRLSKQ